MNAPNPQRQKHARGLLDNVFANPKDTYVIHYSCESFYDREDGRSPRITSIAIRNLASGQTVSFSIHQIAERNGIPLSEVDEKYDCLELSMLKDFFTYLSNFRGNTYLHWNMRDANYGFQAIEHRFRVLGGSEETLYVVDHNRKIDLARLLHDIYGSGYIEHPRLEQLLRRNAIALRDFLPGADEAKAFEEHDFAGLHLSTLRKVDVIANIAVSTHDRNLKTNATWWQMRGGSIVQVLGWIIEHPVYALLAGVTTICLAVIGLIASCA